MKDDRSSIDGKFLMKVGTVVLASTWAQAPNGYCMSVVSVLLLRPTWSLLLQRSIEEPERRASKGRSARTCETQDEPKNAAVRIYIEGAAGESEPVHGQLIDKAIMGSKINPSERHGQKEEKTRAKA